MIIIVLPDYFNHFDISLKLYNERKTHIWLATFHLVTNLRSMELHIESKENREKDHRSPQNRGQEYENKKDELSIEGMNDSSNKTKVTSITKSTSTHHRKLLHLRRATMAHFPSLEVAVGRTLQWIKSTASTSTSHTFPVGSSSTQMPCAKRG